MSEAVIKRMLNELVKGYWAFISEWQFKSNSRRGEEAGYSLLNYYLHPFLQKGEHRTLSNTPLTFTAQEQG